MVNQRSNILRNIKLYIIFYFYIFILYIGNMKLKGVICIYKMQNYWLPCSDKIGTMLAIDWES